MANLRFEPLSEALGVRLTGVNAAEPLDSATIEAISAAWQNHLVLLLPDQILTHEQQINFTSQFGTPGSRSRAREKRPEGEDFDEAVMLVSNIRDEAGNPIGSLPDGEMWFHHDSCYYETPDAATFLYAIELPDTGGNTRFANMYRAYDTLPAALKQKLEGRQVLQIYNYSTTEKVDPDGDLSPYKHGTQPIFIQHRGTGRTALYVNRLMTARIEGLPRHESDAILADLFDIIEDPANIYEHVWTENDLLIWDNQASCHARTDFPRAQRRMLRRSTITGEAMRAAA